MRAPRSRLKAAGNLSRWLATPKMISGIDLQPFGKRNCCTEKTRCWPSTALCSHISANILVGSRSEKVGPLHVPSGLFLLFGQNRTLRGAAVLSLSKFLCVSSQYCDKWHRMLFNLLKTSKDPNIRSNIAIALGDVAVCFSSIFDDNSNELYKGLSDTVLVVKKNTLMVLTHLILNGMIKVKGQLGEMAKCLEDPDPRISDLAKLFFTELSTKDNAIYNNLPDGRR